MIFKFPLDSVESKSYDDFKEFLSEKGYRVVALYWCQKLELLFGITANDALGTVKIASHLPLDPHHYDSFTNDIPAVHIFEREILENFDIVPEGHPWPKPVRFTHRIAGERPFFHIAGDETHEVAVGPIHAGVIEPGHFRFQCHGETVLNLEISLGYQHRGIEKKLIGKPSVKTAKLMEVAAGDTTIGHAVSYANIVEGLSTTKVSMKTKLIRALMLELERLANHTGDLGALAGDVGFLPTSSYCGRIRGDYLNILAYITGSRFSRSMVVPGGLKYDLNFQDLIEIESRLDATYKDTVGALNLLWNCNTALNRYEKVGRLFTSTACDLGVVGVAARASAIDIDDRIHFDEDHLYDGMKIAQGKLGDVYARAFVRDQEIHESYKLIKKFIAMLRSKYMEESIYTPRLAMEKNVIAVSLVEGWRGEIAHIAVTGEDDDFVMYKIVDPSVHNWAALSMALRGAEISDFPICNKSFNLSYSGHDL